MRVCSTPFPVRFLEILRVDFGGSRVGFGGSGVGFGGFRVDFGDNKYW